MDATARELIELFAYLLARCNYSGEQSWRAFRNCTEAVPDSVRLKADDVVDDDADRIAVDVMLHWYQTQEYVSDGQPRPLRARGAEPSIAALVRRVSRTTSVEAVLKYLLETGAVKKKGPLYYPQGWIVQHRHSPKVQRLHHLRMAAAFLRTLEGNARQESGKRQYQFATEALIPESQVEEFSRQITEPSDLLLTSADAWQFRRAKAGDSGERKRRVVLGVFLNDGRRLAPLIDAGGAAAVPLAPRRPAVTREHRRQRGRSAE